MKSTGIIGTAKNTGKTTTLNWLMKRQGSERVAVTGIGYDGEERDNITGLPKPRLRFEAGAIVATAEKCLAASEAGCEIITGTGIITALGEIIVARITKPGLVVIAGPNRAADLKIVMNYIEHTGTEILLVDGSLNRMSPMYLMNEIIFATGGARSRDIVQLASEMKYAEQLFRFSLNSISPDQLCEVKSLYSSEDAGGIPRNERSLYISSFFSDKALYHLMQLKETDDLVFDSPLQILIACGLEGAEIFLSAAEQSGVRVSYIHRPELRMVTVNPFYPVEKDYRYSGGWLDRSELLNRMKATLSVEVRDVAGES
ncbi:MAG: hypothetical protein FMNOHCHN_00121 [Ignavibacteriaceae bacterium]|nr:hypothetical protein [Ignavibacteriaceae bacterium]